MEIFDPLSVLGLLSCVCLLAALAGCAFALLAAHATLRFAGAAAPASAPQPPVTVLKPLHAAEPDLAERLARFCRQDYGGALQIVFGVQDAAAPAAAVARQVRDAFPDRDILLAVDGRIHGSNRKVSNLINMAAHARYDTLVLSDSDILVGPTYLREVTALLEPPSVGAATCLYYGFGKSLWARVAALAINAFFLPQAIAAMGFGIDRHCCGATIALRRAMLERIGGFAAFADQLADDYAIGAAVRAAGYDVVTAPFLVGHACFETSLRAFALHQLRVARTIKSIAPRGYAGTVVAHPLPLAVLGTIFAAMAGANPGALPGGLAAIATVAAALVSRVLLCRTVERRFKLPRQGFWLIPLHDAVAFLVFGVSFFGASVNWGGSDFRVATDGTMTERNAVAGRGQAGAGRS